MTETPAGPRPCARCVHEAYHPKRHHYHLCQKMGLWTPREEAPPAKRGRRRDRR